VNVYLNCAKLKIHRVASLIPYSVYSPMTYIKHGIYMCIIQIVVARTDGYLCGLIIHVG
jgi:hypothetical protein